MTRTRKLSLATLATVLGLGALGSAALAQGRGPMAAERLLEAADSNRDGRITEAEAWTALAARFADVDANKDGGVTWDEFRSHVQAQVSARRGDRPARGPPGADGGARPGHVPRHGRRPRRARDPAGTAPLRRGDVPRARHEQRHLPERGGAAPPTRPRGAAGPHAGGANPGAVRRAGEGIPPAPHFFCKFGARRQGGRRRAWAGRSACAVGGGSSADTGPGKGRWWARQGLNL